MLKKITYPSLILTASLFTQSSWALTPAVPFSEPITSSTTSYKSTLQPLKESATKEEKIQYINQMEIEANKGDLDAQYGMATVYRRGDAGWPTDQEKAVEWYRKAALAGHRASQNSLGIMYLMGTGVEQSDQQAIEWFKKAVAQKSPEAMQSLGLMYLREKGTPANIKEAPHLLKTAADMGQPVAQLYYARLLSTGELVKKNSQEAYKWALLAALQNVPSAQQRVERLSGELTPKQIEAAEAAVNLWISNYTKTQTEQILK